MSAEDWSYLGGLAVTQFQNGGHRTYLVPAFNAVGRTAQDVSALATSTSALAAAAASSYALMAALGASAYSIGTAAMSLPRVADLGPGAFTDPQYDAGVIVNLQNAAYQITLHDFGKLLLDTSGTNTYTLPAATDLPEGWWCLYQNFSGVNLTLARSGTDTINSAATSVTVATGAAIGRIIRRSSSTFLIG